MFFSIVYEAVETAFLFCRMADSPSIDNEKGYLDYGNEKDKQAVDVSAAPAWDEDGPVEFAEKAELRYVFAE